MKQTQIQRILMHMRWNGEITQREAYMLGCQRLASRIHDIKAMGIGIKTETRKVKNMDGSHSYIAVYSLLEKDEDPTDILFGGEIDE